MARLPPPVSSGAAAAAASKKRRREKAGVLELLRRISWLHWAGIVGLVSVVLGGRHFFRKIDDAEALIQGADDAYQRGNRLFQKGNKERAKHHYMKAVTLFPKHVYAWSNLGTVLRELGELQGSVEAHKQALALIPKARNHYNLAVSYQSQGENKAAISSYRTALSLDETGIPDAYFNLGVALQEEGHLEDANAAYLRAYSLDPSNAGAWGNHCNILQSLEGKEGGMEDEEEKTDEEAGKEEGKDVGRVETCYRHLILAHPSYDRAYVNLGGYFYIKGDLEKAAALYMKALEINPENAIAIHALGALQGEKLEGASLDYLSELFDSYSATFDASLHALEYKSPELMRRAVDRYLGSPEGKELAPKGPVWNVLDAGCGTGLSGVLFRNLSSHLMGVDVSMRMAQKAEARGVYDELSVGDMAEELLARAGSLDLIISADVMVYMGRLDYILGTTSKALKDETGLFVFTLESLEEVPKTEIAEDRETESDEGWLLRPTGRYAHRREYVEELLGKVGMEVVSVEAVVGRKDKGQPIPGWLFLCRKRREHIKI